MTVRVKICGLTNLPDARCAVESGADYLGFILARRSPRYVQPEVLARIVVALPPDIPKVAVFADSDADEILDVMRQIPLAIAQLHGAVPPRLQAELGAERIWPVRSLSCEADCLAAQNDPAPMILIDTAVKGKSGGTGITGDWELARRVAARRAMLLAGGLTPDNVAQAVRKVHPFGVDVSSGVETMPGRKNQEAVARFIRAAREAG